jgi:hypothetical protein
MTKNEGKGFVNFTEIPGVLEDAESPDKNIEKNP